MTEGTIFHHDLEDQVDYAWNSEMRTELANAVSAGDTTRWGPPESWPDYFLKRAHLSVSAGYLRDLLEPAGVTADYLPETEFRDTQTPLWGIPDLVVRAPGAHMVIDYKTGTTAEPGTGLVRHEYELQLRIYAYLEFKASGGWPNAWLLPFGGPPIEIEVSARSCETAVAGALEAISVYNEIVPAVQPASPSLDGCRFCDHFQQCDAFWQATSSFAEQGLFAVRGIVEEVKATRLGGITLHFQARSPGPFKGQVTVRRIDPKRFASVATARPGDDAFFSGLYNGAEDDESPEWRPTRSARIIIETQQGGRSSNSP